MSPFVRSTYISIFACTIIFSVYAIWVFHFLGVGYFTGPDAMIRVQEGVGLRGLSLMSGTSKLLTARYLSPCILSVAGSS